jgi:hypothetical protein
VIDVQTTMTWTTYSSEQHAVILPMVGSDAFADAGSRERRTAPAFCAGHGTGMSSFGNSSAARLALMNKSIAPRPTSDVVGVSGIRSWSPPV